VRIGTFDVRRFALCVYHFFVPGDEGVVGVVTEKPEHRARLLRVFVSTGTGLAVGSLDAKDSEARRRRVRCICLERPN
jgi:hypothetical protein